MRQQREDKILCTVLVPVYNNTADLRQNIPALLSWLLRSEMAYEVLLVDDGSDALNAAALRSITAEYEGVRLICHAKNRGQQQALATGFREARGDIVITTDADFVVPASEFSHLVDHLIRGHDLVLGCRAAYRRMNWYRSAGALAVQLLITLLYRFRMRDFGCGTNAVSRTLLGRFQTSGIPADVIKLSMLALSDNPIEVDLDCGGYRQSGSSYSFLRLAGLLLRMVSFRWRARHFFARVPAANRQSPG